MYELFEAIKIVVYVVLVVTEQGCATPATKHDDAPANEAVAIRLLEVIIFNKDPALVWNEGVTVNDIILSVLFIHDILLASPWVPVKAEMKVYGMAAELEVTEPNIIEFDRLGSVSTLTVIVNIGLAGISTRIVTVMRELSGIVGNPVIFTPPVV